MKKSRSQSVNETAPAGGGLVPAGLVGLLVWLVGGLVLEGFHGLKAALYLEDSLRREMWVLAHSHGTLLAALCLVLALLIPRLQVPNGKAVLIGKLFAAGSWMMPLGFFLGGLWHSESDPGIAILFLVPPGGLLLALALVLLLVSKGKAKGD